MMVMNKMSNNNNNSCSSSTSCSSSSSTSSNEQKKHQLLHLAPPASSAAAPQHQQQQQIVRTSSNAAGQNTTADAIWNNIVSARPTTSIICKQELPDEMMTLEDFLAKATAVDDQQQQEDVKIPPSHLHLPTADRLLSGRMMSFDNPPNINAGDGLLRFGSVDETMITGGGKRRALLEPLDKAAQQRQRRMIKNRESAARSRERKQAYQAELESLALKLEEENETLMKAKEEQTKKRYKQLMDNIIPVTEKQRPTRYVMRKVRSMEW